MQKSDILLPMSALMMIMMWLLVPMCGRAQVYCQISSVPQTWDLESVSTDAWHCGLPSCWTAIGSAYVEHYISHSGSKSLYLCSEAYIALPQINMSVLPVNSLRISFYARVYSGSNVQNHLEVGVMSDLSDTSSFTLVGTVQNLTTTFQVFDFSLAGYTGTGSYIVFRNRNVGPTSVGSQTIYIDDFSVEPDWDCRRPAYLSATNITSSSAQISWSDGNPNSPSYNLRYRRTDSDVWQSVTFSAANATYTLTGLEHSWEYEVVLNPECDTNRTSNPLRFSTLCSDITNLPYIWDFESNNTGSTFMGAFPACWSVTDPNNDIRIYKDDYMYLHASSGVKSLYFQTWTNPSVPNIAILPTVDTSVLHFQDMQLSFYASGSSSSYIQVGVMTDPTDYTTFTALQTFNGLIAPAEAYSHEPSYLAYDVPLDTTIGNGRYIAIKGYGHCYLDDVMLIPRPACFRPTKPVVTQVKSNSAVLCWYHAADSTRYILFYKPDNEQVWLTDTLIGYSSDSIVYTLYNLLPATTYSTYVVAECSPYTPSLHVKFTTACQIIESLPQMWDFEVGSAPYTNDFLECWTRHETSSYLYNAASHAHSGSRSLRFQVSSWAALPPIDPAAIDMHDLIVSFDVKSFNNNPTSTLSMGVMSNPNNFNSFTEVLQIDNIPAGYVHYDVPLSNYTGNGLHIAFRNVGNNALMIDDLRLDTLSACSEPSHLTMANITKTTAEVNWVHTTQDTITYYIQCKRMGENAWQTDTLYAPDTLTHSLLGLQPATTYQVRVIASCRMDVPSDCITFTTDCFTIESVPQNWDFETNDTDESQMPKCWSSMQSALYQNSTAAYSGSHFIGMEVYGSSNGNSSFAVLPAIDPLLISLDSLQLSFQIRRSNEVDPGMVLQVGIMSDPTNTGSFTVLQTISSIPNHWQQFHIPLSGYSGIGNFIAVRWAYSFGAFPSSTQTESLFVDDVVLERTPDCSPPSNLTANSVTETSITLSWVGFSSSHPNYTLYYRPLTDTLWLSETFSAVSPSHTLSGLLPSSLYEFYLTTECDSGAISETRVFGTACDAVASLPHTWDFEESDAASLPYCWSCMAEQYNQIPFRVNDAGHAQSGIHHVQFSPNTYSIAILPAIDTTVLDINQLQLSFALKASEPTELASICVGVMTDPADTATFTLLQTIHNISDQYQTFDIPLSDYQGNGVYVAILSNCQSVVYMDDAGLYAIPSCKRPSNLSISEITAVSVMLQWVGFNPQNPSYTVYYRALGEMNWMSDTFTAIEASHVLNGLQPSTIYQIYLVPSCDGILVSNTIECHTGCSLQLPQTWGFEDVSTYTSDAFPLSDCWSRSPGNSPYVSWTLSGNSYAHTGLKALRFLPGTTAAGVISSIDTNLYHIQDYQISFYAKCVGTGSDRKLKVGMMNNPTDIATFVPVETTPELTADYQLYTFPLYAYSGLGTHIAILRESSDGDENTLFVDDVTIDTLPDCVRPLNLEVEAVTDSTALLRWSHNTVSPFVVHYRIVGTAAWQVDTTLAGFTHTLTNLAPDANYEAYLSTLCNPEVISQSVFFTTPCLVINTVPMFWDFESDNNGGTSSSPLPTCWTRIASPQSTYLPEVYTNSFYSYSGSRFLDFTSSKGSYVILPAIDTDELPINSLQMSFYAKMGYDYPNLQFGVMTDPADTNTFSLVQSVQYYLGNYALIVVDFAGYDGNGTYIAIRNRSLFNSASIYLDDMTLYQPHLCETPVNVTAEESLETDAYYDILVTWDSQGWVEEWQVQYREEASETWYPTISVDEPFCTLHGLLSETPYLVRVRSVCDMDSISEWSAPITFTITNVEDYSLPNVTLFPNPATDFVIIQCTMNNILLSIESVEIYDVYGKIVQIVVGANDYSLLQTRMNISNLTNGMYFMRVTTERGVVTKQFVKQ